jgi:hypothetical protein
MLAGNEEKKKRKKSKPEISRGQRAGYAHQRHRDNASGNEIRKENVM